MQLQSIRKFASLGVSLGLLALGLLYLNNAFFSLWVASGPPNAHPMGWERRALGQLAWSVAAFTFSGASYRLLQALPRWPRSALVLLAAGSCLAMAPHVARILLQDRCLDQGGQWSNTHLECSTTARMPIQ